MPLSVLFNFKAFQWSLTPVISGSEFNMKHTKRSLEPTSQKVSLKMHFLLFNLYLHFITSPVGVWLFC